MLSNDLATYTRMADDEVRSAIYLAVRLNLHRLPQLKGTGKVIGADAHD